MPTFPRRLLQHGTARSDKPAFREKHLGIWQTWTWHEVNDEVRALACGLAAIAMTALVFGLAVVLPATIDANVDDYATAGCTPTPAADAA